MFGGPSFPLFRILGFRIGAHWSLLVAVVLMGVLNGGFTGILLGTLVFASILAHELGHAVVARNRRVAIIGIDLHLFGGVAKMAEPPRSPGDEIAIAIAGPLVSLALGVGLGLLAWLLPSAPTWLGWIAGVNLILGVFNLLPALPMDGGRVLRAVLARRQGLVRGTFTAVKVSRGIAVTLAVVGLFADGWLVALAALIWWMGSAEKAQMRRHEALWNAGYRDEHFDPWARYARASKRRAPTTAPLSGGEPTSSAASKARSTAPDPRHPASILASILGQPAPASAPPPVAPKVKIVRDALGRTVVAYHW